MDFPPNSIFLSHYNCDSSAKFSRLSHDIDPYEDDLPFPQFKQHQDDTTVNTGPKNLSHYIGQTIPPGKEEASMRCNMSMIDDGKNNSETSEIRRQGKRVLNKPSKNAKLNVLNRLYCALADTFNGNTSSIEAYSLKPYELGLVKWVVKNKLKNFAHKLSVQHLNLGSEESFKQLQQYMELNSARCRKKGEMTRFIFKLTMKGLKKIYKSTSIENKEFSELDFLNHHFKKHSQDTGTNIMEYADPLDKGDFKNPKFKCLNKEYLSLVFGNEHFRDTFLAYVNMYLENDYKDTVYNKFYHLFKTLRKRLRGMDEVERISIIRDFISRESCKILNLPWSCYEVKLAIETFTKHITKLTKIN